MADTTCTCECEGQVWDVRFKSYYGCVHGYHCGNKSMGCNKKRHGTGSTVIPLA